MESSTGGRLVIVSPNFDGRGGGPPSQKFSFFARKISSLTGAKILLVLSSKVMRANDDRSDACDVS